MSVRITTDRSPPWKELAISGDSRPGQIPCCALSAALFLSQMRPSPLKRAKPSQRLKLSFIILAAAAWAGPRARRRPAPALEPGKGVHHFMPAPAGCLVMRERRLPGPQGQYARRNAIRFKRAAEPVGVTAAISVQSPGRKRLSGQGAVQN